MPQVRTQETFKWHCGFFLVFDNARQRVELDGGSTHRETNEDCYV